MPTTSTTATATTEPAMNSANYVIYITFAGDLSVLDGTSRANLHDSVRNATLQRFNNTSQAAESMMVSEIVSGSIIVSMAFNGNITSRGQGIAVVQGIISSPINVTVDGITYISTAAELAPYTPTTATIPTATVPTVLNSDATTSTGSSANSVGTGTAVGISTAVLVVLVAVVLAIAKFSKQHDADVYDLESPVHCKKASDESEYTPEKGSNTDASRILDNRYIMKMADEAQNCDGNVVMTRTPKRALEYDISATTVGTKGGRITYSEV